MNPRRHVITQILTVGLLVLAGRAHATPPLKGTFEGRWQSSSKLLRAGPKLQADSRVRIRFEEHAGALTVHATALKTRVGTMDLHKEPIETMTTGKIVNDSTVGGVRRVQLRFEGPSHTAAVQKAFDAASQSAGLTNNAVKVAESTQDMVLVQHQDGTIKIESSSSTKRGKTPGFLGTLFAKTIETEDRFDLTPADR